MKNKSIVFILIVLILIPSFPISSYGKGQVMDIDAFFGNFKLKVEGKFFPHKEVFIYDGELWVPMKELTGALGIGYTYERNKRNLKLNSHGKLNIDDNSKEPIAYQRGYEIQAKENFIGKLYKEIQEFEGRRTSSPNEAEGLVRNIKVGFSDINVFLDGKKIFLDREPLLFNDDVYISLISLSPILYITPELKENIVNIDGNAILVDKPGFNNLDSLISFREAINERLDRELAELEKKKKLLMDIKIPYEKVESLRDMEWYLNKHLSYIGELPVDISLRQGTNSWYYLDIDFGSRYSYRWRKLTRRDVEAYVWDIFVAITSLYDEEAKIQGDIQNPYRSRYNYVEFSTRMKNLVFRYIDSGLDMSEKVDPVFIEDLLQEKLSRYAREYFDYSARISGYDLELIVYPDSRYFMDRWSIYSKLRFLKEIDYLVKEHYPQLRINGVIEYRDRESIEFLIENGKVRSPNLERETEELLNDRYGLFRSGNIRIPMKYKLHSLSFDDYKLLIDMDFDINDSLWNKTIDDALGVFLQDVISEVVSIWDMNIFVQAYDKNQFMVKEVVISQDTVQMVTAEPMSGEITEGSTVSLYTNTPDADIYYTLDGSNPSAGNRIFYTKPIVINSDTVIRAYATKTGMKDSPISTFEYKVIDNENIANGLDNLRVAGGRLEPVFDRKVFDYTIDVDYSVKSITINAIAAKGNIEIDSKQVTSGEDIDIDLEVGENQITIIHKEPNKKDRVYTIIVRRKEMDTPDIWLDSDYVFNTNVLGIFKGKLVSNNMITFNGYEVELLSKAGKLHKSARVNSNGSFNITGFSIDVLDRLIGYKYRIIDPSGNILVENEL